MDHRDIDSPIDPWHRSKHDNRDITLMESEITRRKLVQTMTVGGSTFALSGCQITSTEAPTRTNTPIETAAQSAMPDEHGPMRTGRFTVSIADTEIAGFTHVTIPSSTTSDGSDSEYETKTWGQTTYDDLVLERAIIPGDSQLRDWRDEVVMGKAETAPKPVAVTLEDEDGNPQITWEFSEAWIKGYEPPELVASDDGGKVATETVTVAFEDLTRVE